MNIESAMVRVDGFKRELSSNARLRWGLWFSLVLLLFWVTLVWSDFNSSLEGETAAKASETSYLSEIEPKEIWMQRREEMDGVVDGLLQHLWIAESPGLAQAKIQAALENAIRKSERANLVVKTAVSQPIEGFSDLYAVRARVGVNLTPAQLVESLQNLEYGEKEIVLDSLQISKKALIWNVEMTMSAYVSIEVEE